MKKGVFIAAACFMLFLFWSVRPRPLVGGAASSTAPPRDLASRAAGQGAERRADRFVRTGARTREEAPEEIVAGKLAKFSQSRRELARKLAEAHGVAMLPEVERFFDALESGDWTRIETTFNEINGGDSSAGHTPSRKPEVSKMWPAIIDAFGVAEQAHLLPAQALLDYGHSILDSLEPGMVYVGGTDASRWVPALLNDTEEGNQHIIITQNGLADSSYLDYLRLQFAGRFNTLTEADSQGVFAEYVDDASRRLRHDEQFPNEPKQIRPAEEVTRVDGKISVGGRTAVFDINERLLNKLLERNPELSFAIGESIPMPGTYADAVPLGPLMELRANAKESFTPERAAESLDYWRNTAEFALSDEDTSGSETSLKNYSHDATAAARLLGAHHFETQAEEAYLLARKLWPGNLESAAGLAEVYRRTGRAAEAQRLTDEFGRDFPDQRKALSDFSRSEVAEKD